MRQRIKLELTKETASAIKRAIGQITQETPDRHGVKGTVSLGTSDLEELQSFLGYLKYTLEVQTETR
jgi:hypothetical protein